MSESRLREGPASEPVVEETVAPDAGIEGKLITMDDQLCWTNYNTVKNAEEVKRLRADVDAMAGTLTKLKTISMILLVMCGAMAVVLLIHLAP